MIGEAVMGIDPGVRGGLAVLADDKKVMSVVAFKPSMTRAELVNHINVACALLRVCRGDYCYLEKVGYIRGDGGKGSFTFGRIYGMLEGALVANGVEIVDVYPVKWMGAMGCLSGGNKNVTKQKALETFPTERPITHAVADALLIAAYGWTRRAL